MPRWLLLFILVLVFLVFVRPDPVQTGNFIGNAVNSLVTFFRSFGQAINV